MTLMDAKTATTYLVELTETEANRVHDICCVAMKHTSEDSQEFSTAQELANALDSQLGE